MVDYTVDTSAEGIKDFVLKYNQLAQFIGSQGLGNQYVPASSGTETEPAFAFSGDSDTGLYSPGDNQVSLTLGGTDVWSADTTDFTLELNLIVTGTANVQGDVDLDSDLNVDGAADFNNGVTITAGGLDVTGTSVFNNGVTITAGGLDVTGNSSVDGTLTVTGNLGTDGNFTAGGSIDFSTTFAGINKERVVNSFSKTRHLFMASMG